MKSKAVKSNKHKDDSDNETVEKIYQKKTQLEHILLRPDTYIGSINKVEEKLWIYEDDKFVFKNISYVPGLYKIFDEILVNASDNIQRDSGMTQIKVEIDKENNRISVYNNGKGIPVVIHKEQGLYVPELIFGHLLTSSNYDDTIKKVTGGRNGFGAKLTNVFSKKFTIETADSKNKMRYVQIFAKNMTERKEPQISPYADKDYTKVTFEPDLNKFGMRELDQDTVAILTKRVYDMAGTSPSNIGVYLNGKKIAIKNFKEYADFYFKDNLFENKVEYSRIHEKPNQRWEVIVTMSESQFNQCSFVNGICTLKGGTHVNYVVDQIVERISEHIKKKHKELKLKAPQIKQNIWIFINSLIENPTFGSQTKETMTLNINQFGSKCELSEKFFKDVLKSPIVANIVEFFKAKEKVKLHKALSSNIKKSSRLLGIEKLEDANDAGTKNAEHCTLILTEGDSAKALAMSGLEVVGRDRFGVFPLKGKLLNVRDVKDNVIINNEEIQNIIKILGLQIGKDYATDMKSLRYGSLMIMADQDFDGSHIKGLILNLIHFFWPSLVKRNGFIKEFVTPIVKVKIGNIEKSFYTLKEYNEWYHKDKQASKAKIKYYKGLGTSTPAEAKEYFKSINKNRINFVYQNGDDDKSLDLAFSKTNANMRKDWLSNFNPMNFIDHSKSEIRIKDFVDKELIFFSNADNIRSIPSILDGLKPSERKILFSCFKRNLKTELKVAQLAGYVAEHSAYHHGEASLCSTIIAMAQDFVGTNNINLLMPIGIFGNRYTGPKSAASPRYVYTCLSRLARKLFREEDDFLLTYIVEEGTQIEPLSYMPIIPMILVNGCEGIGTGWSTSIPQFDPRIITRIILDRLQGAEEVDCKKDIPMQPWYRGFTGDISTSIKNGSASFLMSGKLSLLPDDNIVEITELPIGIWIRDYKTFLEKNHVDNKDSDKSNDLQVEDIKEYHNENFIHFRIRLSEESFNKVTELSEEEKFKLFKLTTNVSTSNMVVFDSKNKIKKFNAVNEILDEFFEVRLEYYSKRREFLLAKLGYNLELNQNKINFIKLLLRENPFKNLKKSDIFEDLKSRGFSSQSDLKRKYNLAFKLNTTDLILNDDFNEPTESVDFEYLMNMNIWSLTSDRIEELEKSIISYTDQIKILQNSDANKLWADDLKDFSAEFEAFLNNLPMRKQKIIPTNKVTNAKKIAVKKKTRINNNKDNFINSEKSYSEYSEDSGTSDSSSSYSSSGISNPKIKPKKNYQMIISDESSNINPIPKNDLSNRTHLLDNNSLAFIKNLNLKSTPSTTNDVSKLSFKERLALRASQGKIDSYLNLIKNKEEPTNIQANPITIDITKDDETEIHELLGVKRNPTLDLETVIQKTPDKIINQNNSNYRNRRNVQRKIILDEDD